MFPGDTFSGNSGSAKYADEMVVVTMGRRLTADIINHPGVGSLI